MGAARHTVVSCTSSLAELNYDGFSRLNWYPLSYQYVHGCLMLEVVLRTLNLSEMVSKL